MRRRRSTRAWQAEAFVSLTERLHGFEDLLRGRKLLEFRCGTDVGFGFLLDWLQPERLVAVDVDGPPNVGMRQLPARPQVGYGTAASFDAAFLLVRGQLKRVLRRLSLPDVARVLTPGGLLVVTTLGQRWPEPDMRNAELDRSAEAWGLLHSSLAASGFRISEEHLGINRLLVARSVPGRDGRCAPFSMSFHRSPNRA